MVFQKLLDDLSKRCIEKTLCTDRNRYSQNRSLSGADCVTQRAQKQFQSCSKTGNKGISKLDREQGVISHRTDRDVSCAFQMSNGGTGKESGIYLRQRRD